MKKYIIFTGLIIVFLLTGCGSSVRIFHDMDASAPFGEYKSYSFLEWTDGNQRTITGMERERIRAAIARELESKGLTFVEQDADLKVQLTVYFRQARQHYYHYGYPGGSYNYMERALTVDLFDGSTRKHIWHSAAVGQVNQNPESRAEELPELAAKLLAGYPAQAVISD